MYAGYNSHIVAHAGLAATAVPLLHNSRCLSLDLWLGAPAPLRYDRYALVR